MLKPEWNHFYHIYWSLWRQLSSKKSLLVIGRILGLFFNILTAAQKYSLLKRDNLTQPIEMQSSLKKKKPFLNFFLHFWNLDKILNIFEKRWPSELMCFGNYGFRTPWFDKPVKSLVSEDFSKCNMVNGPKHCSNLNHSTFSIFIDTLTVGHKYSLLNRNNLTHQFRGNQL